MGASQARECPKNLQIPCLPKPLKTPLFTLCSSIFPCWPTQTHIQKILQKHCFFFSVFTCFSVKNTVIVFRHKVGPKHWFLRCFQCSGIQKPFKISLVTVFFHLCPFFHCRKPIKMTQNSIYPLKLRHPKIVEKTRKHHQYLVSVRNPGLGAKSFLPPPQLKLI